MIDIFIDENEQDIQPEAEEDSLMWPIHEQDGGFLVCAHPDDTLEINRVWSRYYDAQAQKLLTKYFTAIPETRLDQGEEIWIKWLCILLSRSQPTLKKNVKYEVKDAFVFPLETKFDAFEWAAIMYAMSLFSKMAYKFKVSKIQRL